MRGGLSTSRQRPVTHPMIADAIAWSRAAEYGNGPPSVPTGLRGGSHGRSYGPPLNALFPTTYDLRPLPTSPRRAGQAGMMFRSPMGPKAGGRPAFSAATCPAKPWRRRKQPQIIDGARYSMGKAPAGGPVPKPRVKAYENRTYNYAASSGRGIKNRISMAVVNPVIDPLQAAQSADRRC